jgi:hypothetical protein
MTMAKLHPKPDPLWSGLRVWAATLRDSGSPQLAYEAKTLVLALENYEQHKKNPRLANDLWQSVLLIAQKLRCNSPPVAETLG